ncbi:diaminobutyrate acetyltransferase [Spirillospora sp. NPDC127200]
MAAHPLETTPRPDPNAGVRLQEPSLEDGPALWRMARDSQVLDVNSPYSYTLWCRDFADTSVVAKDGDRACGFITGYVRPADPGTFFVWQVAVDHGHRGRGLARRMLDALAARMTARGHHWLEATVTPDNAASTAMFESFARDHGCTVARAPLFGPEHLPGDHEPEVLFRIGPLPARA